MRLLRLLKILRVSARFGLDEFFLGHERVRGIRRVLNAALFWRRIEGPRAVRLRLALETLGPIFVKFGQMLSTRRDLVPPDIADELAKLQDRVPPFPWEDVAATLQRVYGKPVDAVFATFEREAVASASVAQVHLATLPEGAEVERDDEHDTHAWWPPEPGDWPAEADPVLRHMASLLAP